MKKARNTQDKDGPMERCSSNTRPRTLVDVTCGLEDELKPQRSRAVMDIKLIDGKQVLIIANTSSKYPSIEILRSHEPRQPK